MVQAWIYRSGNYLTNHINLAVMFVIYVEEEEERWKKSEKSRDSSAKLERSLFSSPPSPPTHQCAIFSFGFIDRLSSTFTPCLTPAKQTTIGENENGPPCIGYDIYQWNKSILTKSACLLTELQTI